MKRKLRFTSFLFFTSLLCHGQKKNYISLESGAYFGNANSNLETGMVSSGFGDKESVSFLGLFTIDTEYPRKKAGKTSYRIKYGHYLNNKTAIEAGFGLSYYGTVDGYDYKDFAQSNYLTLTSTINTLYIAWVKTDSPGKAGYGIGPALSLYKLSADMNRGTTNQTKNYLLPGVMLKGFWHFIARPSWFVGMGTELTGTVPAKIDAITITTPSSVSKYKSAKASSFNGNTFITAGFKF